MAWLRRAVGWVGVIVGPLILVASYILLIIGIVQFGLPVLAWLGIGATIFLVAGIAVIYGSVKAERAAVAINTARETRLKHLQDDRALEDETFYVWELIAPDAKPLVTNRAFTNCVIKGPALVTLMGDVAISACTMGEGNLEEILFEMPAPRTAQGIIAFVHCAFDRCKFRAIGFYGEKNLLARLRGGTVQV